jgi:hypothetical protein
MNSEAGGKTLTFLVYLIKLKSLSHTIRLEKSYIKKGRKFLKTDL